MRCSTFALGFNSLFSTTALALCCSGGASSNFASDSAGAIVAVVVAGESGGQAAVLGIRTACQMPARQWRRGGATSADCGRSKRRLTGAQRQVFVVEQLGDHARVAQGTALHMGVHTSPRTTRQH